MQYSKTIRKLKDFYFEVKDACHNFWYFRKVIWNFRKWDYSYTNEVIIKCYEAMYEEQLNFPYSKSDPKEKHMLDIRIIINLLKRINSDSYCELEWASHDKKWGKTAWNFSNTTSKGYRTSVLSRSNVVTEEDQEKERKEFLQICNKEEYLRKQDLRLLGPYFKNMLRLWT